MLGVVCPDRSVQTLLIIYPRKRVSLTIVEKFPASFRFIVGKSEKGYINYETLYEYLCNDFNDWLSINNLQHPVIVWMDWHETENNHHLVKT